jgi:hypothetical protein
MASIRPVAVYQRGSLVRFAQTFEDAAGSAYDPATITLQVKRPGGSPISSVSALTYGSGSPMGIVRTAAGHYYAELDLDTAGVWFLRWESTGPYQSADEFSIEVERGAFA